jgi:hypothetical protein
MGSPRHFKFIGLQLLGPARHGIRRLDTGAHWRGAGAVQVSRSRGRASRGATGQGYGHGRSRGRDADTGGGNCDG